MTVSKQNNFEGQTNGVTPTSLNSTASGSAFATDPVAGGTAGSTQVYSTATPITGTVSLLTTPVSGGTWKAQLSVTGTSKTFRARRSHWFNVAVPIVTTSILDLIAGGSTFGSVRVTSASKLRLCDATGATIGTDSTSAMTTTHAYHIDAYGIIGSTTANGLVSMDVYQDDNLVTPWFTVTSSAANLGTANHTQANFGKCTASTFASAFIEDNFALGDDTSAPYGPPTSPPTAAFTSATSGLTATFDGTTSSAVSPATVTLLSWDFGDGNTTTGSSPAHPYATAGTYTVVLTVTDSNSQSNAVSHTVTVAAALASVTSTAVTGAGFTASAGTLQSCLSDTDPATFITSSTLPTALALTVVHAAMLAPTSGQGLTFMLLADRLSATSGTATAQLYEGATLRSTVSGVAIPAGSGGTVAVAPTVFDFPAADCVPITDRSALKVVYSITAVGAGSTVRVAQALGFSPQAVYLWDGSAWVDALPVVAPDMVVTVQADNSPPRVRIEISNAGPTVQITRTDPDGHVVPVREGDPASTSSGAIVLYDYEMPYNQLVTYTAGTEVAAPVAVPVTVSWLIHPGVPSLSQQIQALSPIADEARESTAGRHSVIGRATPIIVTDGRRKAVVSSLSLLTDTEEQELGLNNLLDDLSPLLLQLVDPRLTRQVYRWIAVDTLAMSFPTDFSDDVRIWTLPYSVIDRPVGGVQAQRTWATLLAECATWADVSARYATWFDVLTGDSSAFVAPPGDGGLDGGGPGSGLGTIIDGGTP